MGDRWLSQTSSFRTSIVASIAMTSNPIPLIPRILVRQISANPLETEEANDFPWMEIEFKDANTDFTNLADSGFFYEVRFPETDFPKVIQGFCACSWLFRIHIPASVERIGDDAFSRCTWLTEVIFAPNCNLRAIQGFGCCPSLNTIKIPASVTEILGQAFENDYLLSEVTFEPESQLELLGGFVQCRSLPRIALPASLEFIGLFAVSKCDSLSELIAECPLSIVTQDFLLRFSGLRRIEVQGDLSDISRQLSVFAVDAKLVFVRQRTHEWSFLLQYSTNLCLIDEWFVEFSAIPEFICVDGCREIPVSMISDQLLCFCVSRSITIPRSIRCIGSSFRSFESCVRELEICPWIKKLEGFIQVQGLEVLRFSSEAQLREISGFSACHSLTGLELAESIEIVDGFNQCSLLSHLGYAAVSRLREISGFRYCLLLREITIPHCVHIVRGFDGCKRLGRVSFQSNSQLRAIDGFRFCNSLRVIEFPRSVLSVRGFDNCGQLAHVSFETDSQMKKIYGFDYCDSLSELCIPAMVEIVSGFSYCHGLCRITFAPNCNLKILEGFDGRSRVGRLDIPASVVKIAAFEWLNPGELRLARGTRISQITRGQKNEDFEPVAFYEACVFVRSAKGDLQNRRRFLHIGFQHKDCDSS